jgi:hypothetical protein
MAGPCGRSVIVTGTFVSREKKVGNKTFWEFPDWERVLRFVTLRNARTKIEPWLSS